MHAPTAYTMHIIKLAVLFPLPTQVFKISFWMAFFNHPSPKRTCCWSTRPEIRGFWLGKLTKQAREAQKKKHPNFKTCIKYIDKQGKKRFHGSKQLKSSGSLSHRS